MCGPQEKGLIIKVKLMLYVINPLPNKITYLSSKNSGKYSISKEYNGLRGLYY
jgi:hypothetical protein